MNEFNQDYVTEYFQKCGCELLSPYKNQREPIQYRCKCGRISTTNFYNFKNSSPYCWDCAAAKQSHSQEFVENTFTKRGCELLDIYKNQSTRMKFRCRCGEISTITFASFYNKGCYCVSCGGIKKLSIEYIKNEISKFNYIVISEKYINARTKLKIQCDKGHLCLMSWNSLQQGARCKACFIEEKWHKPEDRKFVILCRSLLRNCLKKINLKKSAKTEELLGYNGRQLREHLATYPDWNNIKEGDWHIDHIFPIKAFCDYGIKDTLIINCLDNLQPAIGKENLSKGARYNKQEFESWLISRGIWDNLRNG